MCASPAPAATSALTRVFDTGIYKTWMLRLETSNGIPNPNLPISPPKPLLVATPLEAAQYPLVLFLHGYLLYNSFYSQLIHHIASHGFIVIAPQLYTVAGPDASDEIHSAAAVTNWLPLYFHDHLPKQVKPDYTKLGLAGHSRGGKTAFALALKKLNTSTNLKFSALIGIDPVDGMDKGKQTPPPVLTYIPNSFQTNEMAVMVIGSGLGEMRRNPLFPPCAPKGVNHQDFFNECRKPSCYFVVKDYGHTDMLDDDTKGIRGKASYCVCKNGEARGPMRRFVGGAVVAFLRAFLEGDESNLMGIRNGKETLPVELSTVEFLE